MMQRREANRAADIYRGGKRWDFWPSTGRWGRNGKKTCVSGIRKLIEDVLKVQSLLQKSCDGIYRFPDRSIIWKPESEIGWKASWADGVTVQGADPRTGREVEWIFETAEQAAVALMEAGEGLGGAKRVVEDGGQYRGGYFNKVE